MEDYYRYIYFQVLDYTGTPTTSGYTLPITPFTFIPIFDDGLSIDYSKQKILWDFGDGTNSTSVTAVHQYKLPGWYNVKCYVLGKDGEGYTDKFSQLIIVKDFIGDNLSLSGLDGKSETGTLQNPFMLYRFNSWQTYPTLSSEGYKVLLNANGYTAPFFDSEEYNSNKWSHLKPSSRFEAIVYNTDSSLEERTVVSHLYTDNKEIYVKLNLNKSLIFCDKNDLGSCFAGTSGSKKFWFIDDVPKTDDNDFTVINVSFDTTSFKYNTKNYPNSKYPLLNVVEGSSSVKKFIEQLDSDHLTITSNGIDDDNNGNLINTFDIYGVKFTGQKIPFVIRLKSTKDGKELASKYNDILKLKTTTSGGLVSSDVYVELRDKNNQKVSDVQISADFGILSTETKGGYFKGYIKSDKQLQDAYIFARTVPILKERYIVDSTYGFIGHPESDKVHRLSFQSVREDPLTTVINDDLVLFSGLTGIYTSCVTYFRDNEGKTTSYVWLVDADNDKIIKSETSNAPNGFITINLPISSSPSDICADSFGNVWVTLYDSVSTVRINHTTNQIDKFIIPSVSNTLLYGENKVSPASIDTDVSDNVYVSYSTQKYSFIEKYSPEGDILGTVVSFSANSGIFADYQITQIVTDLNSNLWCILKDNITSTSVLSVKNDKVLKIDKNNIQTYFDINGSLWNLTTDVSRNIWVTRNRNQVVRIDTFTNEFYVYSLPSASLNSPNNYISDLEGIACTTYNTILVIDSANKRLHYFNSDVDTYGFVNKVIDLQNIQFPYNRIQNKLNGYGDWNGFKYINKNRLLHIYKSDERPFSPCFGRSNTFSIYDSTSGKYVIDKINENFDIKEQIKSYRFQEYLIDKDRLFDDFIGSALGSVNSKKEELGKVVYEKISNFTDNIANVDTCNVVSLKSIYDMLDEEFYSFNNYRDMNIPAELKRLVDLFSIKFSKLKGSRNKFGYNFDNKGYNNESIIKNGGTPLYGVNKGEELDFFTTVLTAGNHIISYEKFSGEFKFVNTNLLSSSYLTYINPLLKTFALSSYNNNWNWGLCYQKHTPVMIYLSIIHFSNI